MRKSGYRIQRFDDGGSSDSPGDSPSDSGGGDPFGGGGDPFGGGGDPFGGGGDPFGGGGDPFGGGGDPFGGGGDPFGGGGDPFGGGGDPFGGGGDPFGGGPTGGGGDPFGGGPTGGGGDPFGGGPTGGDPFGGGPTGGDPFGGDPSGGFPSDPGTNFSSDPVGVDFSNDPSAFNTAEQAGFLSGFEDAQAGPEPASLDLSDRGPVTADINDPGFLNMNDFMSPAVTSDVDWGNVFAAPMPPPPNPNDAIATFPTDTQLATALAVAWGVPTALIAAGKFGLEQLSNVNWGSIFGKGVDNISPSILSKGPDVASVPSNINPANISRAPEVANVPSNLNVGRDLTNINPNTPANISPSNVGIAGKGQGLGFPSLSDIIALTPTTTTISAATGPLAAPTVSDPNAPEVAPPPAPTTQTIDVELAPAQVAPAEVAPADKGQTQAFTEAVEGKGAEAGQQGQQGQQGGPGQSGGLPGEAQQAAPPGEAQQAAPPGEAQQAAPPGEAQQAAPPGEAQQAAPPGEAQQAAPPGEAQQAAPPGEAQQAAPPGEAQQAAPPGEAQQAAPPGEAQQAPPGGGPQGGLGPTGDIPTPSPDPRGRETGAPPADKGTFVPATKFTFYVPGAGGIEGGRGASLPGPDGKAISRTVEDYLAGRSTFVTIAAVNGRDANGKSQGEFLGSEKGKTINIPEIRDGKGNVIATNVPGVVHDRGGGVPGVGAHYDIAAKNARPGVGSGAVQAFSAPKGGTATAAGQPGKATAPAFTPGIPTPPPDPRGRGDLGPRSEAPGAVPAAFGRPAGSETSGREPTLTNPPPTGPGDFGGLGDPKGNTFGLESLSEDGKGGGGYGWGPGYNIAPSDRRAGMPGVTNAITGALNVLSNAIVGTAQAEAGKGKAGQPNQDDVDRAREYLRDTATPGGTMSKQGTEVAISRLEPGFAVKLAGAIAAARAAGIPVSVSSAYRSSGGPPGTGANPRYAEVSLHGAGAAVDLHGLGQAGSKASIDFYNIAKEHGIFNPYGPYNGIEFNHYQAVPTTGRQTPGKNPFGIPDDPRDIWSRIAPLVNPPTSTFAPGPMHANPLAPDLVAPGLVNPAHVNPLAPGPAVTAPTGLAPSHVNPLAPAVTAPVPGLAPSHVNPLAPDLTAPTPGLAPSFSPAHVNPLDPETAPPVAPPITAPPPVTPPSPPSQIGVPGRTTAAPPEIAGPPHVSPSFDRGTPTAWEAFSKGFLSPEIMDWLSGPPAPPPAPSFVVPAQPGPPEPGIGRTGINDMGETNDPGTPNEALAPAPAPAPAPTQAGPPEPGIGRTGINDMGEAPDYGTPNVAPAPASAPAPTEAPAPAEAPAAPQTAPAPAETAPAPAPSAPAPTTAPETAPVSPAMEAIATGLAAAAAYGNPDISFGEAVRLPALQALVEEGVPEGTVRKLSTVPAVPLETALEQNNAGALAQVLTVAGFTSVEMTQLGGVFADILKTLAAFQSRLPTMPTPPLTATPVLPQSLKRGGSVDKISPRASPHDLLVKKRKQLRQVFTSSYIRGFTLGQKQRAAKALQQGQLAQGGLVELPGRYLSGGSLSKWGRPHPHRGGTRLIHSTTPGRTDRIRTSARPGSFVIPADVVSGMGQGNTIAGAKIFGDIISSYSAPKPMAAGHLAKPSSSMPKMGAMNMPKLSPMHLGKPPSIAKGFADGGSYEDEEPTPIITAGGEMIVDPEDVMAIGGGDPEAGHKALREMVPTIRKQVIAQLKQLPGPIA